VTLAPGLPEDALLVLHELHSARYPALLESVGGHASLGRYDVLFALPAEQLVLRPDGTLTGDAAGAPSKGFLAALDTWWRDLGGSERAPGGPPFTSGWLLYLGYELADQIEPTLHLRHSRRARAVACRMRGAVIRDRATGAMSVRAEAGFAATLEQQLQQDLESAGMRPRPDESPLTGPVEEEAPETFMRGVEVILDAIGRGDVYQANLSRLWRAALPAGATAARLYRRLRRANPAPFAGIAQLPGFCVLSSSPERLLRVSGGVASTRPIAGTRPRGESSKRDASLKRELALNEKERAEHVMLVDLERNDLGRVCRAGSVEVDELMTIESYTTVHHIVSNVRGVLRPEVTPGQAIAAVFPGGTITGCPKIRCMQLLADIEPEPRDAYTGSFGYLGLDGTLDLNILIRTLVVAGDGVEFRTGAGIVADSRPSSELAETRAKARGLLHALGSGA
jgi:anthranilate synthase component 1